MIEKRPLKVLVELPEGTDSESCCHVAKSVLDWWNSEGEGNVLAIAGPTRVRIIGSDIGPYSIREKIGDLEVEMTAVTMNELFAIQDRLRGRRDGNDTD